MTLKPVTCYERGFLVTLDSEQKKCFLPKMDKLFLKNFRKMKNKGKFYFTHSVCEEIASLKV